MKFGWCCGTRVDVDSAANKLKIQRVIAMHLAVHFVEAVLMDTIGLVFTVFGSAAFIFGEFQGWDPKLLAGILVATGFLIGMFVGRFRWQMASITIATVPAGEWLVKQFHPYPTELAIKIPNPYLLFMLAIIVVAFPVTVGGGFRDAMARERPYTR